MSALDNIVRRDRDNLIGELARANAEIARLRAALEEADENLPTPADHQRTWVDDCIRETRSIIRAALQPKEGEK